MTKPNIIAIAAQIAAEMRAGTLRNRSQHQVLNGFLRCDCGKLHTYGGISPSTKCKCGASLWEISNR